MKWAIRVIAILALLVTGFFYLRIVNDTVSTLSCGECVGQAFFEDFTRGGLLGIPLCLIAATLAARDAARTRARGWLVVLLLVTLLGLAGPVLWSILPLTISEHLEPAAVVALFGLPLLIPLAALVYGVSPAVRQPEPT
jgi:hypothetical protein